MHLVAIQKSLTGHTGSNPVPSARFVEWRVAYERKRLEQLPHRVGMGTTSFLYSAGHQGKTYSPVKIWDSHFSESYGGGQGFGTVRFLWSNRASVESVMGSAWPPKLQNRLIGRTTPSEGGNLGSSPSTATSSSSGGANRCIRYKYTKSEMEECPRGLWRLS